MLPFLPDQQRLSDISAVMALVSGLWVGYCALRALRMIAGGDRRSILVVTTAFFFLYALPLALDAALGRPNYSRYPGFMISSESHVVSIVYCLALIVTSLVWWQRKAPRRSIGTAWDRPRASSGGKLWTFLSYVFMLGPVLLLLLVGDPLQYLTYGRVLDEDFLAREGAWVSVVTLSTQLSLMAAAALVLRRKTISPQFAFVMLAAVTLSCMMNGKRWSVAAALVLVGGALWYRGALRGKRFWLAVVSATCLFAVYSHLYQEAFQRTGSTYSGDDTYTNIRIDYGRDSRLKLALCAELGAGCQKILNYRAESLVFYLGMYIPRAWWPEKPLPYAQYVTSAIYFQEPRLWGWGMTTSILDEAVANFGLTGMVLGPVLLLVLCRLGDSSSSSVARILTSFVAVLLLCVHMAAIGPMFLMWGVLVLRSRRISRGGPREV